MVEGVVVLPVVVPAPDVVAAPDVVELPDAAPLRSGAAVASVGSTNAPVPQGIAAFEVGCVDSDGGVVEPSAPAIVKRVVQNVFDDAGERNW